MSKEAILAAAVIGGLALNVTSPSFAYQGYSYGGYSNRYSNPFASYMTAAGQYNISMAQAATSYQQAYSLWLGNRLKHAQIFYELRRMNASYRAEQRALHPPPTSDQLAAFSAARSPSRLDADQLDPSTGVLNWPPTFKQPEFAAERKKVSQLFAARLGEPSDTGLGSRNQHEIQDAVDAMQTMLRKEIAEIGADEYIAAQKFLRSLDYESRFSPFRMASDRAAADVKHAGNGKVQQRTAVSVPEWAKGAVLAIDCEKASSFEKDGQTLLRDLSRHANDAVLRGGQWDEGRVGQGIRFGEADGFLECADDDSLNPQQALTIAVWAKPDVWGIRDLVSKDDWQDGGFRGYVLRLYGEDRFDFTLGAQQWRSAESNGGMQTGRWYHVTGVYDGRKSQVFVNGEEHGRLTWQGDVEPSHYKLRVGGCEFSPERRFLGVVDEIVVWQRALSADDIRELYEYGNRGKSYCQLINNTAHAAGAPSKTASGQPTN